MSFSGTDSKAAQAADSLAQELREDFVVTSGYPELRVYVNYAHGDEKLEQIYGADKLPRLASLKKKWDPENATFAPGSRKIYLGNHIYIIIS